MNYGRAFLAGVVGGAAMTMIMTLVWTMGSMDVNLSMMERSRITATTSAGTWILGFIMHLIISGLIALAYAAGFEYVTHWASWLIGIGFSLIHSLIAGMAFGLAPMMNPIIPEQMSAPGMFMSNKGAGRDRLLHAACDLWGNRRRDVPSDPYRAQLLDESSCIALC